MAGPALTRRASRIALDPLVDVGVDLYKRRLWAQAETLYRYVLEREPDHLRALRNFSALQAALGDDQGALASRKHWCALDPENPASHANLATALMDLGRIEEAEASCRSALKLSAGHPYANGTLGVLLLRTGRYQEAWPHYLKRPAESLESSLGKTFSYWAGEDLTGKSLLILDEQGLGEAFQMASFFSELLTICSSVTLACDPRLADLMNRSFPDLDIVGHKNGPALRNACDGANYVCLLTDLTAHLAADLVPPAHLRGYLKPDPVRVKQLRENYRKCFPGKRLIGFSWSTSSTFKQSARTIPMEKWRSLLAREDCQFFNLQYSAGAEAVTRMARELGVSVVTDETVDARDDIDGLAAQICALDQVISIDNTTVHLAAALGKPVWTLLMKYPHWLWGMEGEHSGWYPTMRLFRQHAQGDWAPVLQAVNAALDRELERQVVNVPYRGRLRKLG